MRQPSSLWRNKAFIRLWLAQISSRAGTEITRVALPLTAVLVIGVTPTQMGLLRISGSLPNIIFGLLIGVWVDRRRRRPILVGADLGRAILLGSIPVAVIFAHLSFIHLVVVIFCSATLTLFFTLASVSILPSLVKRDDLVEANSKLAFSNSLLNIAGPGFAGGLIQLITAPKAIIIDALSYLVSALALGGIASSAEAVPKTSRQGSIWREIAEGIQELSRTPILKTLTLSASVGSLGGSMQQTVLMLFFVHELGLIPAFIGLAFTTSGLGSLLGASLAKRIVAWLGLGKTIILGNALWVGGSLIIPLTGLIPSPNFLLLGLGQMLIGLGATIFSINQMSLRQVITPVDLFARATAARRFLIFTMVSIGAIVGGFLGEWLGLRLALLLGALVFGLGFLLVFFSPVRHIQTIPEKA